MKGQHHQCLPTCWAIHLSRTADCRLCLPGSMISSLGRECDSRKANILMSLETPSLLCSRKKIGKGQANYMEPEHIDLVEEDCLIIGLMLIKCTWQLKSICQFHFR